MAKSFSPTIPLSANLSSMTASTCNALILTALPVEYAAVRSHLQNLDEDVHSQGDVYERGQFLIGAQVWDVGIVEIGMGNPNAAQKTERAIAYFNPEVVLFVGVAGGLKDVKVGDVVVATKVYGYHSGKADTDFKTRPEVGLPHHRILERARAEARKNDWQLRLAMSDSETKVYLGAIAAGEQVVVSREAPTAQLIKQNYGDALAVEMESYGFFKAVQAFSGLEALAVRGISDLLEGKTEADAHGSQERASHHAAAFGFEVLAKLHKPAKIGDNDKRDKNHNLSPSLTVSRKVRTEVREEIKKLINKPAMEVIRKLLLEENTVNQHLTEAENLLVPFDVEPFPIISVIDDWHTAVREGLSVTAEQQYNQLAQTVKNAKEVFEWLLRLAVPDTWVSSQASSEKNIPEKYPIWAEVGKSRLAGNRPFFELDADAFNVICPNQLSHGDLETGLTHEDALTEILKIIWNKVEMTTSQPTDQDWKEQLPLILERRRKDGIRYHITIPYQRFAAISGNKVWNELNDLLKLVGIFVCATGKGDPVLVVPEDALLVAIREFLRLIRRYQ